MYDHSLYFPVTSILKPYFKCILACSISLYVFFFCYRDCSVGKIEIGISLVAAVSLPVTKKGMMFFNTHVITREDTE